MLIIIISRSSLKLDHVGSKTRLLGHQATQVSDLGPLWPSCLVWVLRHQSRNKEQSIANKAEKNPMTLVGIKPGPPAQ